MFSIVLTNGNIINIDATIVEWDECSRTIRLIKDKNVVARFKMDNVVGWIDAECIGCWSCECKMESEVSKDEDPQKPKVGEIVKSAGAGNLYVVDEVSEEPYVEFDDGSKHYVLTIRPVGDDFLYVNDDQIIREDK